MYYKTTASIKKIRWKPVKKKRFNPPKRHGNYDVAYHYLIKERYIDKEIFAYYYLNNMIYECRNDHSVVFVGFNEIGKPAYAFKRSTNGAMKLETFGSDKRYCFQLVNPDSDEVHVFEGAIDLLSYQTMQKMKQQNWNTENYLSIGGVSSKGKDMDHSTIPIALQHFLMNHKNIKKIYLHLDNDVAGIEASEKIIHHLKDRYDVIPQRPRAGDCNKMLMLYKTNHLSPMAVR